MIKEKKRLKLGKVFIGRENVRFLKGQDSNVSWQLNLVTAVFIRDSLKAFSDNTLALPKTANKPFNDLFEKRVKGEITAEEYDKIYSETFDKLFAKWKNTLLCVADEFDKYIALYNLRFDKDASCTIDDEVLNQGKLAFDKLKEIYDDLEW